MSTKKSWNVIDPMNGETMATIPLTSVEELKGFAESLDACPKSGLHNPLKNTQRYVMYGKVCQRAAAMLNDVINYL